MCGALIPLQSIQNTVLSQQRFIIPIDFKLVTICTRSSTAPLIIPPAFLLTHLPQSVQSHAWFLFAHAQEISDNRKTCVLKSVSISATKEFKVHPGHHKSIMVLQEGWHRSIVALILSYSQYRHRRTSMHCIFWEGCWQNYKYANIQVSSFRHAARLTAAVEAYQ